VSISRFFNLEVFMPSNFDLFRIKDTSIIDASVTGEVIDTDGDPSLVLDVNFPFTFQLDWTLKGSLPPLINGFFHVDAYAESMGPGPEIQLGSYDGPVSIPSTPYVLRTSISVPASTITSLRGAYKLTAVLTHRNAMNIPTQMAGFYEGPMVQFYKAP
jgi:hypothetical protein